MPLAVVLEGIQKMVVDVSWSLAKSCCPSPWGWSQLDLTWRIRWQLSSFRQNKRSSGNSGGTVRDATEAWFYQQSPSFSNEAWGVQHHRSLNSVYIWPGMCLDWEEWVVGLNGVRGIANNFIGSLVQKYYMWNVKLCFKRCHKNRYFHTKLMPKVWKC